MPRRHRFDSPTLQYLYDRFIGDDPVQQAGYEEARTDLDVAMKIYALRKAHGLSQVALAKLIGTTASAISRLEDADYEGHSLRMLRRVGLALGCRVEVRFVRMWKPGKAPRKAGRKSNGKSSAA
jgi:DNA-binding XRE family transcriptional regulator